MDLETATGFVLKQPHNYTWLSYTHKHTGWHTDPDRENTL
jgi:hypothetical protein